MTKVNECMKIGNKYFLASDVEKVLVPRIRSVIPEDIEEVTEE